MHELVDITKIKTPPVIPESMTFSGAQQIARRIVRFWRDRGHTNVRAEVVRVSSEGQRDVALRYDVRTNLVNGMPPSLNYVKLAA